jgi:hypothetical protein
MELRRFHAVRFRLRFSRSFTSSRHLVKTVLIVAEA